MKAIRLSSSNAILVYMKEYGENVEHSAVTKEKFIFAFTKLEGCMKCGILFICVVTD